MAETGGADALRSARGLPWAAASILSGLALHVDRVPFWASAAAIICVAWRLLAYVRPVPIPSGYARLAIALVMVLAVLVQFRTLNGLSAGTALLVVMGSVKLLETRTRRDLFIVVGVALFLLIAACLERQSLLRAPWYLLHAWLCCSALALIANAGGNLPHRTAIALAGRSLLLASPLAILLFLLFPRLSGAFWVLPPSEQAVTGLSETMSPMNITELATSYEPAFRVKFEGSPPPHEELYWRALVLHDFDGFTWTRARWPYGLPQRLEPLSPPYRYEIALEPHSRNWWFTLDTVLESPHPYRARLTADRQLIATRPVTQLTTYEAVSYIRTRTADPISKLSLRYDTALPPDRNPRAVALAQELRAASATQAEFVQRVLAHFREGGFEYTLTPPRTGFDSVDGFLFETKQGFCGHFASAFATLMRAGGVPARVVVGYLGGEWNPIGEYYIVRQSEAHAWTEIWSEGTGWVRVDPTAVVEPARLRRGVFDLLPGSLSVRNRLLRETPWLSDAARGWDALNAWWNRHVVKFDFNAQLDLLSGIGIDAPEWKHLGWGIVAGLCAWLGWLTWQLGRSARRPLPDRLARAYARLCDKLARAGVPREAHQGPLAYAETIATKRPDLERAVGSLLASYAELRYGNGPTASRGDRIAELERAVSKLRLGQIT